jgi:hypothetical protein
MKKFNGGNENMELVSIFMGMGIISTVLGGVAWYNKKDAVANDAALTAGGFFVLAMIGMLFV